MFPCKKLPHWLDVVVSLKLAVVRETERGDLPPTIIAERKGRVVSVIISSPTNFNRDSGLIAAKVARLGFAADTITAVFDAHMKPMKQEDLKNYKYGEMQRQCDEEGACEHGEITDCMSVLRINLNKELLSAVLPYSYHGKSGTPFHWSEKDFEFHFPIVGEDRENGIKMAGVIPENLSQIMALPSIDNTHLFHTVHDAMKVLRNNGFLVVDFLTEQVKTTIDQYQIITDKAIFLFQGK